MIDIQHNYDEKEWTRLLFQNREFVTYQIIAFDVLWENAVPIQLEDIKEILKEN